MRARLGSVRELVAPDGSVAAQYDYDPYGKQTVLSGTVTSDIGFAGYFNHAASGLDFTVFRAYDPTDSRWLNRDPIGEIGGLDLYAYGDGDPLDKIDPTGHNAVAIGVGVGLIVIGIICYASGACQEAAQAASDAIDQLFPPMPTTLDPPMPSTAAPPIPVTNGDDPPSAKGLVPFNPGKDCNGNCNPCPPNQIWAHPGDAHGSTGGVHYHGIVWNQNLATCMCYPDRVSGPDPQSMK